VELAEAFAKGPAPARTLLFLLVTGEEIGLLGTKHYLDAPLFPLELTCCNLNYEMIGRADELVGGAGRLWLTGHNRSNLMAAIEEQGISISADLRPEENFFERSDNYAFAVRGIVAQTFSTYNMHSDYHKVGDEWQTLDYEHMETATREAYRIARLVADGAIDPAWLPGGKPRGR
jgi:Zn-dependent M28 family amino/carboxypeptidase